MLLSTTFCVRGSRRLRHLLSKVFLVLTTDDYVFGMPLLNYGPVGAADRGLQADILRDRIDSSRLGDAT